MIHFPKCSVCPVAPEIDCHAQRTGAAHAYCRRIKAGDPHARALVLSHSEPEPAPEVPTATLDLAAVQRAAKPRMALGVPQKPPVDCIPCQEAARSQSPPMA